MKYFLYSLLHILVVVFCIAEGAKRLKSKANIVLILTDDQDIELGSLKFMPKLSKYIKDEGAFYQNGFTTTPMCCPSRSSMLTGLYAHNHHVYTNNDNCSSTQWINNYERKTYATYIKAKGYKTAYYGKYLNKYNGRHIPEGWDEWHGLVKNSRFYNYTVNTNGVLRYHGDNYPEDYLPDVITEKALKLISESAKTSSPFMAVLSYPGPHGPEDAAPQFQGMFTNVTTHHTPAYNFAPNPDKQWILRHTEKMLPIHMKFTDMLMTKRLQTLQSIDSAVEKIVKQLSVEGVLENTYIFYTSDHGYHLGQFGLVKGKAFPFDFDTHVPFLVRGPGISPGSIKNQPVLNIDLAPTFLDIAGVRVPSHMDGLSIVPTFRNSEWKLRDGFLIERGKMTVSRYKNLAQDGKSVSIYNNPVNERTTRDRLYSECQKRRYQPPCRKTQSWVCKKRKDGTLKISKCRNEDQQSPFCNCKSGEVFGWRPKRGKVLSRKIRSAVNVDNVIEDLKRDEIMEVDMLVEDVAREISSLHGLKNCTDYLQCNLIKRDEESLWTSQRKTIKGQIQQLRAQLNELKQIRKYLRMSRPRVLTDVHNGAVSSKSKVTAEVCFCNMERSARALKSLEKEKKRERRLERLVEKQRKEYMKEKRLKDNHCRSDVRMNCFSHDNHHWKTAPVWNDGPFCACTNSNNNTYWCVRTVNGTHNYLYCEYVTGMITFFDVSRDPYQLRNLLYTLKDPELSFLHDRVSFLKNYSGSRRNFALQRIKKSRRRRVKGTRRRNYSALYD